MALHPSLGRRSAWRSASFAIALLCALVAVMATARTARADGAKRGGEVAGLLATESSTVEAPKPRAKTTASAKPSRGHGGAHAGHAKHPGAKHGKPGHAKHGNAVKPAKAKPAKGPAKAMPARRGPRLRA